MKNIDFGIDLGTTNSGIGRYENGKVQVLKNPVGLGEILPSVVSFYRGRTLVGNKAREQYLTNAGNVFGAFKRKMGTAENYAVTSAEGVTQLSPVDLSAYILKELKNYVPGTSIEAAVITIPASFDTIQSNATKQAGYQAGFKEVVLLQEPIAACLAYANLSNLNIEDEQKWLVYDFGGGTFDVALVYINKRELRVLDNRGNNFLGGVDIDHAFLAGTVVPKLSTITGDSDMWNKLVSKDGAYEKLWYYLGYKAEEAKKELSVSQTTWMEIDFPELEILTDIELSRDAINSAVKPKYKESEKFVIELLAENNLTFKDIERVILVGGTTYIPFIKDALRGLGVKVDDSIDPTTAVITGAAYFAGAHQQSEGVDDNPAAHVVNKIDVKLSYETYSNDLEELIAFKATDGFAGHYRITRADGGFDTGLLQFNQTANEFVTLLPKAKNNFKLSIYNNGQQPVFETTAITISHGLYGVAGQLLPEDICIELDSKEDNTYLEVIFKRNNILPLSKTLYKTFSRSIIKNSTDKLIINVVEGKSGTLPGSNLSIGYIAIEGSDLQGDLIQGTDVEIQLDIDESRGLKVDVYIPSTGQQISQSFHISAKEVNLEKMLLDIAAAENTLDAEIAESSKSEAYELSAMFQRIKEELQLLKQKIHETKNDKVTEERYRLDDTKRKLLSELDSLTRSRDVFMATSLYKKEKERYLAQEKYATAVQKAALKKIFDGEKELLQSGDKHLIKRATQELESLNDKIFLQNDEAFISLFWQLNSLPEFYYADISNLAELSEAGQKAIEKRDYLNLKHIVTVMFNKVDDVYKVRRNSDNEHFQHMQKNPTFKTGLS
ncbi:Hsp70 family protein [Mucilaginibacter celer]|uniref:Hsp70 family protein n=1 Tax=Mucilaginibacter celer TaxID=2305508 RepID=A0A494VQT7_9SPHI|nr:Hsp70 family protein [Mucilaginibacter celer]AYL97946.1 Hsp70 family protein [Mucilaginibacter celer]